MWCIRLSNSVFINNSASMVSVNFIMKYLMQQYSFNSYQRISDEFGLTCFVKTCSYELWLSVTNIPNTIHSPANYNVRIGYGTFDRCSPGTVVQNGQLSKSLPSIHLPKDLVVFKDFQLSVCRQIHSMSVIHTSIVIKNIKNWLIQVVHDSKYGTIVYCM